MPVHVTPHRVRFHELDPYNHVNHAMYVTYFEIGRVDALEHVGLGLSDLQNQGFQFVVTRLDVRFRLAAEATDDLEIHTSVSEMRRASTVWDQQITRGNDRVATSTVIAAITDTSGKPTRPPAFIFEQLAQIAT